MPIPKYDQMYNAVLEAIADGNVHDKSDVKKHVKAVFNLTDEEMAQRIPSGRMTIVGNRVGWAKTYLKKAGLLDNPKRNQYSITEEGQKALEEKPDGIDNDFLMKYESFREFIESSKTKSGDPDDVDTLEVTPDTPQEVIENAMKQIEEKLADDLMDCIMQKDPAFFERLVVDLLGKIGYGKDIEDAGVVTKISGDGGIDGFVRQDVLGFDKIFIQAKRWDLNNNVGSPEITQFIGALIAAGADKGVFITTSSFSQPAKDIVAKNMKTHVVLIDGKELTRLMIRYGLGVSVVNTLKIKAIDTDYFESDDE